MADYFAPQLYWTERQTEQRFTRLLAWWASENVSHRHLWPGINTADIGKNRTASEIVWQTDQIGPETRSSGVIHWTASALRENRDPRSVRASRPGTRIPVVGLPTARDPFHRGRIRRARPDHHRPQCRQNSAIGCGGSNPRGVVLENRDLPRHHPPHPGAPDLPRNAAQRNPSPHSLQPGH